jgi:hypothetical protein
MKFDADDPRFTAVYNSHHYNVDPSDPHFKRTNAFNEILSRTSKKIKSNDYQQNDNHSQNSSNNSTTNSWTQLVRTVKNKTQQTNNNKRNQFYTNQFKT